MILLACIIRYDTLKNLITGASPCCKHPGWPHEYPCGITPRPADASPLAAVPGCSRKPVQQYAVAIGSRCSSEGLQHGGDTAAIDWQQGNCSRSKCSSSDTRWMQRYMAEIWKELCMAIHFSAWQRRGLDAAVNDYNTEWRYDSARRRHKINGYQQRLVKPVKL